MASNSILTPSLVVAALDQRSASHYSALEQNKSIKILQTRKKLLKRLDGQESKKGAKSRNSFRSKTLKNSSQNCFLCRFPKKSLEKQK